MKKWLVTGVAIVVASLAGGLVGCSPSPSTEAPKTKSMQIVDGGMGGSGYIWGAAAGKILSKYTDMSFSVRSGAADANVLLVEQGQITIGQGLASSWAIAKKTTVGTNPQTRVRMLWLVGPAGPYVLAPKDSQYKFVEDIPTGTRWSLGTAGSSIGKQFELLQQALGRKVSDYQGQYLSKGAAAEAFREGKVDYLYDSGPLPNTLMEDTYTSNRGAKMIPFKPDTLKKWMSIVTDAWGNATPYVWPKETHGSLQGQEYSAWIDLYEIYARDDFPEDTAYRIAKVLTEHFDELKAMYPPAGTPESVAKASHPAFPMHPGVAKYFKEKGLLK